MCSCRPSDLGGPSIFPYEASFGDCVDIIAPCRALLLDRKKTGDGQVRLGLSHQALRQSLGHGYARISSQIKRS